MREFIIVRSTYEHRSDADAAAAMLVDRRHAACVQVSGPISSTYWWGGEVHHADEWLLEAKCRATAVNRCVDAITATHPYETPEVIAVPIVGGSTDYLRWLDASTE
jgi:periplasmic divalent cation tolerance protein